MRSLTDSGAEILAESMDAGAEGTVSVIVPVAERPDPLAELYDEYSAPLRETGRRFEFVFVMEPWFRKLVRPLEELIERGEPIAVLEVGQAVGEAALVKVGLAHSSGSVIVTLPAYPRVEPEAIPELVTCVDNGIDLATARRWPRHDSWVNRFQNRAFHVLIARLGGKRITDVACGVRAMRRGLLEEIPLYGDFYRFLPLLALRDGYRVEERPFAQHSRDTPPRVYRPGVYLRRLIDILGLFFLLRFTEKPLRFFGLLGSAGILAGGAVLAVLLVQRLLGQGIADRPLLLLGVLLIVLGVQAVALGLIGEIIVHLHAARKRPYRLAEPVGEEKSASSSLPQT